MQTWHAILLGLLEGLTEFIPVSSTGHLLLAGHFLGFNSPGKTFEVLIQLGAVLAVLSVYTAKLLRVVAAVPHDGRARRFLLGVLVAAAAIGIGKLVYLRECGGSPGRDRDIRRVKQEISDLPIWGEGVHIARVCQLIMG